MRGKRLRYGMELIERKECQGKREYVYLEDGSLLGVEEFVELETSRCVCTERRRDSTVGSVRE